MCLALWLKGPGSCGTSTPARSEAMSTNAGFILSLWSLALAVGSSLFLFSFILQPPSLPDCLSRGLQATVPDAKTTELADTAESASMTM